MLQCTSTFAFFLSRWIPQCSMILTKLQHPIEMNLWLITSAMDTMITDFDYLSSIKCTALSGTVPQNHQLVSHEHIHHAPVNLCLQLLNSKNILRSRALDICTSQSYDSLSVRLQKDRQSLSRFNLEGALSFSKLNLSLGNKPTFWGKHRPFIIINPVVASPFSSLS